MSKANQKDVNAQLRTFTGNTQHNQKLLLMKKKNTKEVKEKVKNI